MPVYWGGRADDSLHRSHKCKPFFSLNVNRLYEMGESEMMKEEGRKKLKAGQGRRDRMQENDMPTRVAVVGFYVHMRIYYVHLQSTPLPLTRVIEKLGIKV